MSLKSAFQRGDGLLFVAWLVSGFCCFGCDAGGDAALRAGLNRLRRGGDGRGTLDIQQNEEMKISDELLLRIGTTSVTGFGLMDLISMETSEDGVAKANLIFPQLRLTSSIHVVRSSVDATTSGEAILRFLDSQLHLQATVEAAALKEVEASLEVGTVTTAFDLDSLEAGHSAGLQVQLMQKRDKIAEWFKKVVEKEIVRVLTRVDDETSALSQDLPVSTPPNIQKANRFVDQLLKDNRKALEDAISYIKLPDEYFEFSKKIVLIETHGFARLTKGHLNNLHAISRKGDCVLFAEDDVLNVVVDLGLDNVLGAYYIETKFGFFGATSDLKLKIESVELIIKTLNTFRKIADQDHSEENNVLDFDLALNIKAYVGHIDVDVNISKAIDWLINFIAEKVVKSLKSRLQGMIKDPIRNAIKGIMNGSF